MAFRMPTVMNGITQSVTQLGHVMTGRGNDAKYFQTSGKGEIQELKDELNSKNKERKKEAIKKIIAAMTIGKDVSGLFPDVVNCLQTSNIELKRLVYLYIINYAKLQPELAILAINTFRKDCLDSNPLIRALAVRTMGCIQLKQVEEYLVEPLRRACKDGDPYVRKTAAACICKLYDTSPEVVEEQEFISILINMLQDTNPNVVTNAIATLDEISEASGKNYLLLNDATVTRLLQVLNESSEWGQVFILDALTKYTPSTEASARSCIEKVLARLSHANPAVVLSSIRLIFQLLNSVQCPHVIQSTHRVLAPPLITLLTCEPEIQYIVLRNIILIVQKYPDLLRNDIKPFYCKYNDPPYVKLEKIEILVALATNDNIDQILQEFSEYMCEVDMEFVRRTIRAVGRCALMLPKSADRCITTLLSLLEPGVNFVVQEVFVVIKDVLRCYPSRYDTVLPCLCDSMELLEEPEAKAAMIWIIGEYAGCISNAVKLLEFFLESFDHYPPVVCQQILTAAVKVFLQKPKEAQDLVTRVLKLCSEKSNNPDLRDRSFMYWRLLSTNPDATKSIVLQKKPPINYSSLSIDDALLNILLQHMCTVASVLHRSPQSFILRHSHADRDNQSDDIQDATTPLHINTYADIITRNLIDDNSSSGSANPSEACSSWSSSSAQVSMHSDLFNDLTDAAGPTENKIELLSPTTCGCQGETGLAIHGCIDFDTSKRVVLKLAISNKRPTGTLYAKDWMIQVNKNPLGFVPQDPTHFALRDLPPGHATDTEIVLIPQKNMSDAPCRVPLVLQVALKTTVDIFYMTPVPLSIHVILVPSTAAARLSRAMFKKSWERLAHTRICCTAQRRTCMSAEDVKTVLKRKVQLSLVSQHATEIHTSLYFSGMLVNNWAVLVQVVIESNERDMTLTVLSDQREMAQLLQDYIVSVLNVELKAL